MSRTIWVVVVVVQSVVGKSGSGLGRAREISLIWTSTCISLSLTGHTCRAERRATFQLYRPGCHGMLVRAETWRARRMFKGESGPCNPQIVCSHTARFGKGTWRSASEAWYDLRRSRR
ncbi:uncharacterized protein K452DRAFT_161008 [Aplosporella prunicola CBS 121167]|uniref:Secreted protein n=1 Tax=Aplosporella prunicola CBS 121167 TaxID=1176127 RepID=A0A6A6BHS2_9PEZI|nr:uncharacterized protein K452DRAFT_161008 [Aplosporella prunicola CBS 121167]KAF2143692.1 hypothetical protein K452DRAFT_161008 [Aplosporella prunicola CBS 121167]